MVQSLDKLRKEILATEGHLEELRQDYAEGLWALLNLHPAERVTLHRVVDFFLEQEGSQPTEAIADFLRRIEWPSKTGDRFVSAVGTQLRQRSDLFRYDKKKRVWHRKTG